MVKVKRIAGGTDNCYVVTNGREAILVDTASGPHIDKVTEVCDRFEMKLIVLTHVHFDHAENAAALSKRYDIPVAIHPLDEELFENFDYQPLKPSGIVGRVVLGLSKKPLRETKVERPEKLIYIQDGDDLGSYGIPAKVIGLPGHTKGSIGLDVAEKYLFVGDELDNWLFPGIGHLYHDPETLRASAEKVRSLGDRIICYGHGKPTKNGKF